MSFVNPLKYKNGISTVNGVISIGKNLSTVIGSISTTSNLNVSGNSTILGDTTLISRLNVSGDTIIKGDIISLGDNIWAGDTEFQGSNITLSNIPSGLQPKTLYFDPVNKKITYYDTPSAVLETKDLEIQGESIFFDKMTGVSSLFISGNTILQGSVTTGSSLNVFGDSTILGHIIATSTMIVTDNVTASSNLNVGNNLISNNIISDNISTNAKLNVSGSSNLNNVTVKTTLNVSGNSTLNDVTVKENLIVEKNTSIIGHLFGLSDSTFTDNVTTYSNLFVSGMTTLQNNSTALSNFNISGNSVISGNLTVGSNLNIMKKVNIEDELLVKTSVTILGNLSTNSNLDISGNATILGDLYVLSNAIITDDVTCVSNLNVSGTTNLNNIKISNIPLATKSNVLYYDNITKQISYGATPQGGGGGGGGGVNIGDITSLSLMDLSVSDNTYINSDLNVSGNSIIFSGIPSSVSNNILYFNNTNKQISYGAAPNSTVGTSLSIMNLEASNKLNISGNTILNNTTINSSLFVGGSNIKLSNIPSTVTSNVLYYDNTTKQISYGATPSGSTGTSSVTVGTSLSIMNLEASNKLNISGNSILNSTTINSTLFVSGSTEYTNSNIKLSGIPSTVTSNVLYYDNTTKQISYGATPSGGTSTSSVTVGTSLSIMNLEASNKLNVSGNSILNSTTVNSSLFVGGSSVQLSNIPSTVTSNVLYYDNTTKQVSYGATPSSSTSSSSFNGSSLSLINLNVSQNTIMNYVSVNTELNVNGNMNISGTLFASGLSLQDGITNISLLNLEAANKLNVSGLSILNTTTVNSSLFVGGSSLQLNNIPSTVTSKILYYDDTTKLVSYGTVPSGGGALPTSFSSLMVNGYSTLNGNTYINGAFTVNNSEIVFNGINNTKTTDLILYYDNTTKQISYNTAPSSGTGSVTVGTSLSVFNLEAASKLNVSGLSILNTTTVNSSLFVGGSSVQLNNIPATVTSKILYYDDTTKLISYGTAPSGSSGGSFTSLNVLNDTVLNSTTINSSLYVSGTTILTSSEIKFTNIPTNLTNNILYFDDSTGLISYGTVPSGGSSALPTSFSSLMVNGYSSLNGPTYVNSSFTANNPQVAFTSIYNTKQSNLVLFFNESTKQITYNALPTAPTVLTTVALNIGTTTPLETKSIMFNTPSTIYPLNMIPRLKGTGNARYTFGKTVEPKLIAVGEGTNTIAYSTDPNGSSWTGLGTSIFSTRGNGVAWNGDIYVAVGTGGFSVATSTDGINWTGANPSGFTNGLDICWGMNNFIAVGDSIIYSSDGITWTTATSPFTQANSICFNGSMFVAVGSGTTNSIAYSMDGINWVGSGLTIFNTVGLGVCWNGNKFVAVGKATYKVAYSKDGITWTTTMVTDSFNSVAWNGSRFVGVGATTSSYSEDGINWTTSATIVATGNRVYWTGTKFLCTADTGIYISKDGNRWERINSTMFSTSAKSICYNAMRNNSIVFTSGNPVPAITYGTQGSGSAIIVVGGGDLMGGGMGTSTLLMYSNDNGLTWTNSTSGSSYFNYVTDVVYGAGKFVAVGEGMWSGMSQSSIAYSSDGITWTSVNTTINPKKIAFGNNIFVIGGNSINYSTDGANWQNANGYNGLLYNFNGIIFANNKFYAFGYGPSYSIISSSDGIEWSGVSNFGTINCMMYANNKLYAATSNSLYYSSDNGSTWNSTFIPYLSNINAMTYGNGVYIIVGMANYTYTNDKTIAYSLDGLTWNNTSAFTQIANDILFNGTIFIATGKDSYMASPINKIYTSSDGVVWTPIESPITVQGNSITTNVISSVTSYIKFTPSEVSNYTSQLDFVADSFYNDGFDNMAITIKY